MLPEPGTNYPDKVELNFPEIDRESIFCLGI
jgi:hypothetical protein